MKGCPRCAYTRGYQLSDDRGKCGVCGHRYGWTSVWDSIRLSAYAKGRLLEMFTLGVPVFRQRFGGPASAASMERFYRLCRAGCAWEEQLREPFAGTLERDDTSGINPILVRKAKGLPKRKPLPGAAGEGLQ